jgi:hypothetical protein
MMDRGASLVEVIVAICICMVVFAAAARLSIFSARSGSFAEAITYASVYGHTKLSSLLNLPEGDDELRLSWHHDPENPIRRGGMRFFRFWKVDDGGSGRKVVLYVVWDNGSLGRATDFGSEQELMGSRCFRVRFSDVIVSE